ncbi:MAG: ABC transporter ATP-binding protein [Crocinitomicaceae bacterium]|nr:ABC transporter ATP-binding protein [Crocinitomicaceae bacterium]
MKSLSYLNKYFFKYKWRLLLGTIFIVISNYFGVQMPLYVKSTIDDLMKSTTITSIEDALYLSLKIGGIYMLLSLISGFFLFLMRQTIIVMSRLIEFDLKNEIYSHYQKLDFTFYKKNATGDLMNRISEDVSQVRMYLGPGIMYSINLVALSILIITQMVKISPYLTVFVLIPLPVMSFLIYKVSSKMNLMSKNVQVEQSMLSTLAQETFAGIRVVKAYSREKEAHEKFNATAEEYKTKSMKMVIFNAFFMPTIVFLIGLSTLLTIYIGGKLTYDNSISIGGIVAFIFFVNKLTWPFASIGWVTSINQRAAASQTRINEFLMTQPMVKNTSTEAFDFDGNIEFKNVSYTYENSGITALKNINFTLEKGKTLGIIGRTGSGKTTLLNLLMRQMDVETGELYINNHPIKTINLDSFRSQTGIVPQDVFLFSDTISNNILFGSNRENVGLNEVIESTKKAHVYENIIAFPDQFETLLGERGVNLSGGQKQRISIARALIRNPKLLILDDCLSAVDTETEEIILNHLKEEFKTRTSIIVSHRISSIRHATKLIVLEHGTIIETGTHESLLALNGIYTEMYHKQLADEKDLQQNS